MALKDEPITANTSTKRPISGIVAGAAATGAAQAEADNQNLMSQSAPAAPAAPAAPKLQQDLSEPWSPANKSVGDSWAAHYGNAEATARKQAVAPAANPNGLEKNAFHLPDTRGF